MRYDRLNGDFCAKFERFDKFTLGSTGENIFRASQDFLRQVEGHYA